MLDNVLVQLKSSQPQYLCMWDLPLKAYAAFPINNLSYRVIITYHICIVQSTQSEQSERPSLAEDDGLPTEPQLDLVQLPESNQEISPSQQELHEVAISCQKQDYEEKITALESRLTEDSKRIKDLQQKLDESQLERELLDHLNKAKTNELQVFVWPSIDERMSFEYIYSTL